MSKTETDFRQPHCFAPVVGGGGCLEADLFSVNRSFWLFRQTLETPEFSAKTVLGPPRSFPHQSNDSNEVRDHISNGGKIKSLSAPDQPSGLAPKRGGLIWAGGLGCNPESHRDWIYTELYRPFGWHVLNLLENGALALARFFPAEGISSLMDLAPCPEENRESLLTRRDIGLQAVSLRLDFGYLVLHQISNRDDSNQPPPLTDGQVPNSPIGHL